MSASQINISYLKLNKLVELLSKGNDKRYLHSLYLASCYFSADSASTLIKDISKLVRLQAVYIYIDRKTACTIGKDGLYAFIEKHAGYGLELYTVDANTLFHSKAYALISFDKESNINRGSLVIGSSNLTGAGLTDKSGNIECMLDSHNIDLLLEFLEQIKKLKTIPVDEIDNFRNADSLNFKYALLLEGNFIHKWMDNLGQYLSVRYQLNENGKNRIGDEIFREAGFNIETATISKRYFQFEYEPPHLENTENLVRNFGLETYLGYWIPNGALEKLFEKDKFDEFRIKLTDALSVQKNEMTTAIANDLEKLRSADIIQTTDESDPIENLLSKIESLLQNEEKLKRIFSKYEIFSIPYDINQRIEISELFDQMVSFAHSRPRKNVTQKAFLNAINTVSLDNFRSEIANSL